MKGHGLGESWSPMDRWSSEGQKQFKFSLLGRSLTESMQSCTDLSFLQFAEIRFGRIQICIDQTGITFEIVLGRDPWPIQLLERCQNGAFQ
jgi:hypothetical protein